MWKWEEPSDTELDTNDVFSNDDDDNFQDDDTIQNVSNSPSKEMTQ